MAKLASEIWRDYATDGVPGSGAHNPVKADIREWAEEHEGRRTTLTATTTFYVSPSGSNSNDGLTSGTPWQTLAYARTQLELIDPRFHTVVLQLADGTYVGTFFNKMWAGPRLILRGNTTTPSNVLIDGDTFHSLRIIEGFRIQLEGVKLQNTVGWSTLNVEDGGDVRLNGVVFGDATSRDHIEARAGAIVRAQGAYEIDGDANSHLNFASNSTYMNFGVTVTLTGTPAFASSFARFVSCSVYDEFNAVYSGAATGKRYNVTTNAVCDVASATHFPGDVAGTTANGGVYAQS